MCYRFAKNYVGNEKSEVKGARKDNSREIIILQLHILGYTWCFSSSEVFHDCCHQVEEPEIKLPTSAGSWKKQESSRKNLFLLY